MKKLFRIPIAIMVIIIPILLFAFTPFSEYDEMCPTEDPQNPVCFAHPYDHTKFLQCSDGKAYEMSCSPGLIFDVIKLICGWADDIIESGYQYCRCDSDTYNRDHCYGGNQFSFLKLCHKQTASNEGVDCRKFDNNCPQ